MRQVWWAGVVLVVLVSAAAYVKAEGIKYDPMFGNAWEAARTQKAPRRWLECVIRVTAPVTDQTLSQLAASGFKRRSVVVTKDGGAIITGRIQVRHVTRFLELPFVASVEGGGMGGRKRTQGLKTQGLQ
jgi:hypothetical protein